MQPVRTDVSFPELEHRILSYWREQKIFERSMDPLLPSGEKKKAFTFYDGPPFATGLPHYGHLLAGTIKDVVGRFFTMKGFVVDRRFGWDCHGVPVEFEVQKALDLHGTKAIKDFGVGRFNEECRKIVLRYAQEWQQFVERSGRWVDFERDYKTMDRDYMESIWWAFKRLWERGLIYEGVKCVAYSPAINTPLSNFEANLNFKMVQDPAVTVRLRLTQDAVKALEGKTSIALSPSVPINAYIWTTTPWTLPANFALAVGPDIDYALVSNPNDSEIAIVANTLAEKFFPGASAPDDEAASANPFRILAQLPGSALEGLEYEPMFPYFAGERERNAFRIYPADFVSADDGTGIVHCASFGEDDLALFQARGIAVIDPLDADGCFTDAVPDYEGLFIKDADPKIIADMKKRGQIVRHETLEHSYPFCYRTDKPLFYRSVASWFVRVEQIRDLLVEANRPITWVPEHVKVGRFGKWLENARDWAISRNRFWGNPLPVWRCDVSGALKCIGSVAELEELSGQTITDLHSHFVDEITFPSEAPGGTMRRVPEVLDCWFESGAMPYAQIHYPFENRESFDDQFPADFIAEGLDQTRGWFYTLLVMSTALFGKTSFKNVIVNGIVLAEDGKKMSKSLKNFPPPGLVMEKFGADAMRLYLLASGATRAEDLRFSEAGVQGVVRQTLLPLWNAYNFFVTYALVDDWKPSQIPTTPSPNVLDRWILSKLGTLMSHVDASLSSYKLYAAAPIMLDFVDELTNWYIRLNRRRFWAGNSEAEREDKMHAYATLHRVLLAFVRVLAPMAPFISEEIFLNLRDGVEGLGSVDSVHLAAFPTESELTGLTIDEELEVGMEHFESLILLGRGVRNDSGVKTRQPLAELTVIHPSADVLKGVKRLENYIREELNVKSVVFTAEEAKFVDLKARLNTKELGKVLGPKLGSGGMRELQQFVEKLSTADIWALEEGTLLTWNEMTLSQTDVLVHRQAKSGLQGVASSGQITIMLDMALTDDLRFEGLAREFVNRIQKIRKDSDFQVSDRIVIEYMTACPRIEEALVRFGDYVREETLAAEIRSVRSEQEFTFDATNGRAPVPNEIDGKAIIIGVAVLT